MRKLLFWIPIIAGTAATLLMLRRGAPLGEAAKQSFARPIRTLAHELKNA